MNLEEFDKIIWAIIEESISKNLSQRFEELSFGNIKERLRKYLFQLKKDEENKLVKTVIEKVLEKLNNLQDESERMNSEIKKENRIKMEGMEDENKELRGNKDVNSWK